MSQKPNGINRSLIALCSSAIVSIAAAAPLVMAGTDATVGSVSAHTTAIGLPSQVSLGRVAFVVAPNEAAVKKSTKSTTTSKKLTTKQKYKDGTYKGTGSTRIGSVTVAITLKKDKITRVQIVDFTTHYPIQYIDPVLPNELLKTQNINKIDAVSGATLSSEDFYEAVVTALNEAQQAERA
ncbi:FMN-binding protein [Alicyclobacillus acidiphilus]|uniref:FMN-binding protein n=1 Tax=Alicyclobacillus acidiphilus TaxID=182455 RepID=UPI000832CC76|nr:FMN-binding protein [Alicyclobacillus acidiphilus]